MTRYDIGMRRRAVSLFDAGAGAKSVAGLLGLPLGTVGKWYATYRAVGSGVLLQMGTVHKTYDYATKLEAVRAFVDYGESRAEVMSRFSIASLSSFKKWCAAYRKGGAEALRPKPKGRPRGSGPAPEAPTREEELEERVRRLEAENAYLKKSIALKARKRSQERSGRR